MRLLLLVALLALVPASVARADGDPASDVLLSQDSYLPYAPKVQERLKTALEDVLAEAKAAGFPMKVALINTESDLGAYPDLFNQPQRYADLLRGGLSMLTNRHGDPLKDPHLLVVMPGGFGGTNLGEGVDRALAPISIKTEAQSDGLAQAAIEAVARLATENGHPVEVPPEASIDLKAVDSSERKSTSPLVFAAPALLLFVGLFVAGRISARRRQDDAPAVE